MTGKAAYIAGTFDTKERELLFVQGLLSKCGLRTVTVDLGTSSANKNTAADVSAYEVAKMHPDGPKTVFTGTEERPLRRWQRHLNFIWLIKPI